MGGFDEGGTAGGIETASAQQGGEGVARAGIGESGEAKMIAGTGITWSDSDSGGEGFAGEVRALLVQQEAGEQVAQS